MIHSSNIHFYKKHIRVLSNNSVRNGMSSQEYEPGKLYPPQGFLKALVKEFQEITRHYTHPAVLEDIENS